MNNETGSIASALGLTVTALVTLFILIFYVFGQIVYPDEIGIRQNYFNISGVLKEGFQDNGLFPGLHWKISRLSTIHLFDCDFQFVILYSFD